MTNLDRLKEEIKKLYPNQEFSDGELVQMANSLIKFFTIGFNEEKNNPNS